MPTCPGAAGSRTALVSTGRRAYCERRRSLCQPVLHRSEPPGPCGVHVPGVRTRDGSGARTTRIDSGGPVKVRSWFVTLVALSAATALAACAPPDDDDDDGQRRQRRHGRQDGHLGRGLRRHGRPGQGRPEGGQAQRHRAAAGLGQLRRDHQGVLREVRHQGPVRPARRRQPGRDQRRQPAQGHRPRSGRVRPRPVGRPRQHRHVRAVQGGDLRRHPGRVQGPRRRLGQRLRRLHVRRLRLQRGPRRDLDGRPARPGLQGQGRAQRRPDRRRCRVQRRGDGLGRQRRLGRRHRSRRGLLHRSSRTPATSCRSTRPRRRSSPDRPRSSSTGTT